MGERIIWVWQSWLRGGMEAALRAVAAAGGTGVAVKVHDGDPTDDDPRFRQQFLQAVQLAPALGLTVDAWGYCYGNKYGRLMQEADAAIWAIRNGARRYICDAEGEWETPGSDAWVEQWATHIRSSVPSAVLGYAPFWNTRWHGAYPYQAFSRFCQFVAPQVYWRSAERTPSATWQITLADFSTLGIPIEPIGQIDDGVTVPEVQEFLEITAPRNVHWWDYDGLSSPEVLAAACAGGSRPLPESATHPPTTPSTPGSSSPAPPSPSAGQAASPGPSPAGTVTDDRGRGIQMFTDADQIPPWARDAVDYLARARIIQGDEAGRFLPNAYVTRAQMAVLLYRVIGLLGGQVSGGEQGGSIQRISP